MTAQPQLRKKYPFCGVDQLYAESYTLFAHCGSFWEYLVNMIGVALGAGVLVGAGVGLAVGDGVGVAVGIGVGVGLGDESSIVVTTMLSK